MRTRSRRKPGSRRPQRAKHPRLLAEEGGWRISGLIDWEAAFSGSLIWDLGSLFRYGRRYSETFRQRFERGYRDAGGALPEDWLRTARLLDAARLVATLNEERELPVVFAECRKLILSLR